MIRFFKSIRYKNLTQSQTGKYLLYAIGEIALVMIGILLALQVNNWNEARISKLKTEEYYSQLLDDLKSDQVIVNNTIDELSTQLLEYEKYVDLYNTQEDITPYQVHEQISKLSLISNPITFNTSTIEALQNSGDIRLISSNIRNGLIDLKRLQNLTIKRFEDTQDGASEITQRLSSLIGATTLPKRLENQSKMKEFLRIDENLRELILAYEGIHRCKEVSYRESVKRLGKMSEEIDGIEKLIDSELNK